MRSLLASAGSTLAATATYPGGGSGFDQSSEGWSAGPSSCTPAELLCSSEAVYDASTGNPPAKRKRLLVREKVRAGGARATVYKSRKLIRKP